MVRFNCTSCNAKLMVPDKFIGKASTCPKCKSTMTIPLIAKQHKESYVATESLGNKTRPTARSGRPAFTNAIPWIGTGIRNYFIFVCIAVTAVAAIGVCIRYFRGAGDDSMTYIREVAADPQAYADQTLTSRAIMNNWNRFADKDDGRYLALGMSPDLKKQAEGILQLHGGGREVSITYQLYDRNTLAQLRDYQEVEEISRGRSQRKRALEKERNQLDSPLRKFEANEKLRLKTGELWQQLTKEKEQLAKELTQYQTNEANKLQRTGEIETNLQLLSEERAQLVKERMQLLASDEENKSQRASEIKARLQQMTEEKKDLANEKDQLHPELKVEAELQRLAKNGLRLRGLAKDRERRKQFNTEKARLAKAEARSLGEAASQVRITPPRTSYPTYSRRRRVISTKGSYYTGGPTSSQLAQEQRADAERKAYAAQKKRQSRLLSQQKRQTRLAITAKAQVARCTKELVELQRLIKGNVERQRVTREKQQSEQAMQGKHGLRLLARSKENLQKLAETKVNLQRLTQRKEELQPLAKPNAPRLAAIADEIRKIEEADKNEEKMEIPVGSDGVTLNDPNCVGVLLDINVSRYR